MVARLLSKFSAPQGLRDAVLAACSMLYGIRQRYEAAILIGHEAFTGMTADLLAQSIERWHRTRQQASHEATAAAPEESADRLDQSADRLDLVRVLRTTGVSLVSDDLPFLVWSRYLWLAAERFTTAVRASTLAPGLVRALTNPISVTLGKTAITQLFYETTSDSAYLAMQAWLRGGGMPGVLRELKAKLWTLRRDGLVFWSAAHIICFSMPVWWMMPIADNSLTMVFNVYQSLLAHSALHDVDDVEETEAAVEEQGTRSDSSDSLGASVDAR